MPRQTHQGFHVEELLEEESLQLAVVAGAEGLSRRVETPGVHRPGLALAGYLEGVSPEAVQIVGEEEARYIVWRGTDALPHMKALCALEPPCIILADDCPPPDALAGPCDELAVPLMRTPLSAARVTELLGWFLSTRLAAACTTHGVLVDVFGVGVLLLGESAIGKSEVALDLVLRGHMLVADDVVELRRGAGAVFGSGPELLKHHIEIRGLGILNIKDLFGIAAVRDRKRVDLVAELADWDEDMEYDRLGVDEESWSFQGVEVPLIRLPVRPGRNMSTIIEVAARNELLKRRGHHSARKFQDRIVRAMADGRGPKGAAVDRGVAALTSDVE